MFYCPILFLYVSLISPLKRPCSVLSTTPLILHHRRPIRQFFTALRYNLHVARQQFISDCRIIFIFIKKTHRHACDA